MHVMLKATDFCNMNCVYCYVSQEQRKQKNCIPIDTMPLLFRSLFEWQQSEESRGQLTFNWSGGEVLSLPAAFWQDVIRIQKEVYASGRFTFHIENGIQTNLTLLTDEYYEVLQNHGISLGTTIDGPKHCMDRTRVFWGGGSAYDVVMRNLDRLITKYNCRPGVILILSRHNVEHIDEIYSMFKELHLGFKVNAYHYAPQSQDCDATLAISEKGYLDAMCHLFDLWSEDTEAVAVENFAHAVRFLTEGRVTLCNTTGNCASYFACVRWNGDVFPCNEFGGDAHEQEYCYGNVFRDGWQAVRDHPSRQTLLRRDSTLRQLPMKEGGCRECRYWDGCHGGCMHCTMRHEYHAHRQHAPTAIIRLRDSSSCSARRRFYSYIESRIKQQAIDNHLPIQLHLEKTASDVSLRRESFYRFHRQVALWNDRATGAGETDMEHLAPLFPTAGRMLTICWGQEWTKQRCDGDKLVWSGCDYRETWKNDAGKAVGDGYAQYWLCEDIRRWREARAPERWDCVLINPYWLYGEDVPEILASAKRAVTPTGYVLLATTVSQLAEREYSEVADYPGVRERIAGAPCINVGNMSIARLPAEGDAAMSDVTGALCHVP